MGRPRQITDEQLDAAARATFVELGAGAPVAEVARRLGVSHAALLQRAGSKERLLLRSLRPGAPEVADRLAEPPPPTGRAARLEVLLGALLEFHGRMLPGLVVLRAGGLPAMPPPGVEPPTVQLRRLLAGWLARAEVPRRRAAALAEALLGAIEARCFNAYVGGPGFVAAAPERFIHELVSNLCPELSERSPR